MMRSASNIIDCDIHCAVPTAEDIYPHLSEHWREYLRETGFTQPAGLSYTYPAWSEVLATRGDDLTLNTIRSDVLSRAGQAILHCYYGVESLTHPYLASALARGVNRWLQTEWLDHEPRLAGSAVIATQHAEGAIEEIHRIGEAKRFVQILLPSRSWELYGNQRYWPIWEAAQSYDLVLALGHGGAAGSSPTPVGWLASFFESYVLAAQYAQSQISSLIYSGVFDQFPQLKVVVTESGWTWVPAFLWRLDTEWKSFRREVPWVQEPPSAYVRRHVRFTTQPVDLPGSSEHLQQVFEQLGSQELLMFGSELSS